VITAASGSDVALNYGSGGAAAVQWTNGTARVVYMGFPFETITQRQHPKFGDEARC
jgi:hypothetical protein